MESAERGSHSRISHRRADTPYTARTDHDDDDDDYDGRDTPYDARVESPLARQGRSASMTELAARDGKWVEFMNRYGLSIKLSRMH